MSKYSCAFRELPRNTAHLLGVQYKSRERWTENLQQPQPVRHKIRNFKKFKEQVQLQIKANKRTESSSHLRGQFKQLPLFYRQELKWLQRNQKKGAMLCQLSYETTQLAAGQFVGLICSREGLD